MTRIKIAPEFCRVFEYFNVDNSLRLRRGLRKKNNNCHMILRVKIMHRMAKVNRQRIANRCCIRIASSVIPLRASLSAPGVGYHCSYCAEDTRVLRFVARQLFLLGMVAPSRFRCMGRLAFWSYAGGTSSLARRSPPKKKPGGTKTEKRPGSQAGRGGGVS